MRCEAVKLALCLFGNVLRQTRFIPGRRVLVNKTLVDRLVDKRNGRVQKFGALVLIA